MARTDILIDPDNIDAITAGGSFTLSTTVEDDPDIRLIPKRARLVLGGSTSGEDSTPDGEIWLATSDGEAWTRRVDLSASRAGFDEEQVLSAGSQRDAGRLNMGRVGDGQPTVSLNAERGHIRLNRIPEEQYPYGRGDWAPQGAISLDAKPAHIIVGGGDQIDNGNWVGKSGSIELRDAQNNETVTIQGGAEEDGTPGGKIQLKGRSGFSNVRLNGRTGTLQLGQSIRRESVNGELWLDDGRGSTFGLKAEDGLIGLGPSSETNGNLGLVLNPQEGLFSIMDGNGNAVFRVDTQNEEVQIAENYSRSTM